MPMNLPKLEELEWGEEWDHLYTCVNFTWINPYTGQEYTLIKATLIDRQVRYLIINGKHFVLGGASYEVIMNRLERILITP